MTLKIVKEADFKNKRVFVRVDFNVPVGNNKVQDDRKIKASLPTLKYLLDQGAARLTLATHFSNPSTPIGIVKQYFSSKIDDSRLMILDNLRLNPGEEANDIKFASSLAQGHDIYINDAFSVCHRAHASVVAITGILPAYAGFLVQKEVENLTHLITDPERPFVVVVGGAKVDDKIKVIKKLRQIADKVLIGGKTGIEYNINRPSTPSRIVPLVDDIDGYDIGPKTIETFKKELSQAKTVFWNGNMGKSEDKKYARGTREIANHIALLKTKTYVGGGDTLAAVDELGLSGCFTFLSTGGGATLEFLASYGDLPGLRPLYKLT